MTCSMQCMMNFAHDTSPGKISYQNCTMGCGYEYPSVENDALMTCMNVNQCLVLPELPSGPSDPFFNRCGPAPETAALKQEDLMGEWWAGVGFHPLYDCGYKCQKTGLSQLNGTHYDWKVDMQVPLAD